MADMSVLIRLAAEDLASPKVDALGGALDRVAGISMAAVAAGVAGLASGLGVAITAAANFEQTMSGVKAVSGATADQMAQLSSLALQLGKDTVFSAADAGKGLEELVKSGVSVQDIMGGAAKATLNLATAGGVDLVTAAGIASNALNSFNLSGTDMAHVSDMIAGAANASAIDVNQFGQAMAQSSAVAATVGISFDDLSVAIAEMGNAGIKGQDAGTSLKTMLLDLTPTSKQAAVEMKALGIITADGSNSFFDAQGHAKGLADVSQILQDATRNLTDQQRLQALQTIFGTDAIRAASVMAKNGAEGFDSLAGSMAKVTAESVAAERLNNLRGDIEQLKGSVETAAISLGETFQPQLRAAVQNVTTFVNALIPFIETYGPRFAAEFHTAFDGAAAATQPLRDALAALADHAVAEFTALADAAKKLTSGDLPSAFAEATGAIAGFGGYLIDHLARWSVALEMWALDAIPGLMQNLGDVLGSVGDWISGTGADGISGKMPAWLSAFVGWAEDVYGPLVDKLGDMLGKLGGWITGYAAPFLGAKLVEWGGEFSAWVVDATPKALAELGNLGGQVVKWVGDQVPTWAFELGKWTGEFTRWVGDAANALPGKLGGIADSIKAWVTGDGLKSTSDAAGQMGKSFMDGLTAALLNGIPDMVRGLQAALDGALNAFKSGFSAAGGVTPGHPNAPSYDFSASIGTPQYGGSAGVAGTGGGSVPAPGDVNGWRNFLRPFVPAGLQGDDRFLDILLAGGKAESGLDATSVQPTYIDAQGQRAGGAKGLFQFDPGGMGANVPDSSLFDPNYEAGRIVPEYAKAYQTAPAGLDGASLAAYVAGAAEKPYGWTPGAVDYATAGNYRAAYTSITGGAGEGNYGPMPNYGPEPVSGLARANAGGAGGPSVLPDQNAQKLADLLSSEGINWTKTLETETNRIAKSVQDETTKLAKADADAARATAKVDTDSARAISDVGTNRSIQDDITQRKNALTQSLADDKVANDAKVAAQELVYQRGLQNDQISQSRKLEDTQIQTQQTLAAQALTHSRTLEDQEIQYQNGLQKDATAHARQLEDAKLVSDQKLQLAATEHQRALQDQQTEVSAKLAAADLVHQRALQDAARPVDEGLQDTATAHSRQLQDQQTAYDQQTAQQRDAVAFQLQLSQATSDAQKQQLTDQHNKTVANAALQAQYAAEDLAHSRAVQDQEAQYQEALQTAALARSRAQQDAEIQYQAGVANRVTADQRVRDDQEAAYQRTLAATALQQSRTDQDTEQAYKDTLARTALQHSRTLQDTEIGYQITQAKTALDAKRVLEDAALADQRTKEDAAIQHKADLETAARQFAATEKAKQDAFDKQLADEADKRAIDKINENAALQKKDIADRLALQKQSIIEASQTQLDAEKATFDLAAAAIIDKARIAVTKAGGDFGPIEDSMKGAVASMDQAFATAHDNSANALADLAAKTLANLGDSGTIPSAINDAATAIDSAFGVSDTAVELFGQQFGLSWSVARPLLGQIEQGIYTNLGPNGLIPNHIKASNDKVIEFAKQWGVSWPEAAAILTTESTRIKATFGEGGEVPSAMGASMTAAYNLDVAIQSIKDKHVSITVDTVNNTAGGNIASSGGLGGIGSSSSNNLGGSSGGSSSSGPDTSQSALASQSNRADLRNQGYQVGQNADGSYYAEKRASGGPVLAGHLYQVNEDMLKSGAEFFVPATGGYISPSGSGSNSGSDSGGDIHVHITVQGSMIGTSPAQLAALVREELVKTGKRSGPIFGRYA